MAQKEKAAGKKTRSITEDDPQLVKLPRSGTASPHDLGAGFNQKSAVERLLELRKRKEFSTKKIEFEFCLSTISLTFLHCFLDEKQIYFCFLNSSPLYLDFFFSSPILLSVCCLFNPAVLNIPQVFLFSLLCFHFRSVSSSTFDLIMFFLF